MTCCHCQEAGEMFDDDKARDELHDYRRNGPPETTTQLLIDGLRSLDLRDKTLLDIGGGVGAIPFELFSEGLAEATFVEASPAYAQIVKNEARRRGYDDRMNHRLGDIVDLAPELPDVDLVTLDRVICCYPDLDALVEATTSKAKRWYGVVYPKERWYTELGYGLANLYLWTQQTDFRMYSHDDIDETIRDQGFVPFYDTTYVLGRVTLYEREELVETVSDTAVSEGVT